MAGGYGSGPGGGAGGGLLDEGSISGAGTVMSQMRALFTPPGRDARRHQQYLELAGTSVELHPYYRRPGKGHNHDCCDACGEGGDLICCDNCPASFHFSCHAPPMEEEDIPMGDWMCLRCYVREKSRLDTIKANHGVLDPNAEPSVVHASVVALTRDDSSASGSNATDHSSSSNPNMDQEVKDLDPSSTSTATAGPSSTSKGGKGGRSGRANRGAKKQLEAALKADKEKNAKKYKLKYDKYLILKPVTNSPFDALIAAVQVANADQHKLAPEFNPQENLPWSWKWSEEREDEKDSHKTKLCNVCSKSGRNMPSVACDFCPLVYHLDCLNPPLCEIPRERWMCPSHVEHYIDSHLLKTTRLTERLKLWNKYAKQPVDTETVRADFFRKARTGKLFQRSRVKRPMESRMRVPQYIKDHYAYPLPGHAVDTPITLMNPMNNDKSDKDEMDEFLRNLISLQSSYVNEHGGDLSDLALRRKSKKPHRKRENPPKAKTDGEEKKRKLEEENPVESGIVENGRSEEGRIEGEDPGEDSDDTASNCSLNFDGDEAHPLSEELRAELAEYLSRNLSSQKTNSISPSVRDYLALQKLNEIFPAKKEIDLESSVQARAALIPINGSKVPCLMAYRTLNIGIGSNMELDLSTYGHCNFASSKHASLYFDQYSQVYELINYSEHGTLVDNTIYALEYDGIKSPSKAALKKKLKALGDRDAFSTEKYKMSDVPTDYKPCHCSTSMAKVLTKREGTETSAIVQHGSYIRIGCLQFVFSVMEYHGGISLEEKKEKEKEERIKKAQKEREEKELKKKREEEEKSDPKVKEDNEGTIDEQNLENVEKEVETASEEKKEAGDENGVAEDKK